MQKLYIKGGKSLKGELQVSGAKNAVLPIIAAALLTDQPLTITNVPLLRDVKTMLTLLQDMGVHFDITEQGVLNLNASGTRNFFADYDLVRTMRASILVLGPLLAKFGQAKISLPGGCAIGARPVDIHLRGLEAMGATIKLKQGYINAQAKKGLRGADIHLPKISVTGTENLLMAASLARGRTVLYNAAREPEIVDLATFLNQLGANIQGAGSDVITIDGVTQLSGGRYQVMPDRIEAGTLLAAAMMTQGDITLKHVKPEDMTTVLNTFEHAGADIDYGDDWIALRMAKRPQAVDVTTAAYPGFPTDMQAQMMAINSIAKGNSHIKEMIFENRFMHVQELRRMGADIELDGHAAYCRGVKKLIGAKVMATDLRASAALVLAGLAAEGETVIDRVYHIDRGYVTIEKKLSTLGAIIERIN
ncbi:MAG: UDP-N-acetylglucosamine 1-carboxyvinyltransferase [Pseudomonadota bacterium]